MKKPKPQKTIKWFSEEEIRTIIKKVKEKEKELFGEKKFVSETQSTNIYNFLQLIECNEALIEELKKCYTVRRTMEKK